jgi:hypothetical protein
MIHAQLNYLIAQQRIDEARRVAERERFARSIHANRSALTPIRRIARLRAALHVWRPLPIAR